MSKKTQTDDDVMAFTFGDDIEAISKRDIFDYIECNKTDKWYEPPVDFTRLAQMRNAAVHHDSALTVKCNILSGTFEPTKYMDSMMFQRFALNFVVFGNSYYAKQKSILGNKIKGDILPAKYMRVGLDPEQYFYVPKYNEFTEYKGNVFHLMSPDINQEIYGLPQYLSAINSIMLNESATLFRRRYYKNGSHAGYILYMTDSAQEKGDIDAIRQALKDAKGPGNFRNLFVYAPGGKEKGIQIIPVAEAAAKDEFTGIKNISRDDMLAIHRVPPQLMGIIPNNTGGFGDAEKAAKVCYINELKPIQTAMLSLNEWLGDEVIRFREYELAATTPA
ncbi:phage portal protein [Methylophilus sp. 3sh_L]|uniref:phage portal protein n=1 Tax=Methylophilus sp. 3sh_L TaxID=3377114 RepID=UPI00398F24F5